MIATDQMRPGGKFGLIFNEYQRALRREYGKGYMQTSSGVILQTLINSNRVLYNEISIVDDVAVLPADLEDSVRHDDDRKFVAVSLKHPSPPPIVNSEDSDWVDCKDELRDHGVHIIQLCPELFRRSRGAAQDEI